MNDRPERIIREFTPEEQARRQRGHEDEEEAMPQHLAEAQRRRTAMQEPGLSGELRRAVAASRLGIYEVSERSRVPLDALNASMAGDAPLDTDAASRITSVLNYGLAPTD